VEEVTRDHVPVVPAFARSVAHDLRGAYRGLPAWTEPPIDMEQAMQPSCLPDQPDLLSAAEAVLADRQLCRALQVIGFSKTLNPNPPPHPQFLLVNMSRPWNPPSSQTNRTRCWWLRLSWRIGNHVELWRCCAAAVPSIPQHTPPPPHPPRNTSRP